MPTPAVAPSDWRDPIIAGATLGLVTDASKEIDNAKSSLHDAQAAAKTTSSAASSAVGFLQKVSAPALWMRLGIGALGVLLLVAGFAIILSGTKAGKTAIDTGTSIAKVAAIA